MTVLDRLASALGRRDEAPNQELARDLAASGDRQGIALLAENLAAKNAALQADCLKVLYEIGFIAPELVAPYAEDFLRLLKSRNNRLVWGGMIALGTVAARRAEMLFQHRAEIQRAMESGSVITVDNAVQVFAQVAAGRAEYSAEIFPLLLAHLGACRPKDVAQHAEKSLPAVNAGNAPAFIATLETRLSDLSPAQSARVKKVIKAARQR